jgi:hypothetical protein
MLFSIAMEKFDSLLDHLLKLKDIREKSMDKTIKEEDMVVVTLNSFPFSYANSIETLNITSVY